jgi:HPt (histidine-containing phosphotransfer) domain-containing protein
LVAEAAHRLKGEAATFDAGPLMHCADCLETAARQGENAAVPALLEQTTLEARHVARELAASTVVLG